MARISKHDYADNYYACISYDNNNYCFVVFLWKQKGQDLSKLDYKRHKFGVTYLSVANDCTGDQIDDIVSVLYYIECY